MATPELLRPTSTTTPVQVGTPVPPAGLVPPSQVRPTHDDAAVRAVPAQASPVDDAAPVRPAVEATFPSEVLPVPDVEHDVTRDSARHEARGTGRGTPVQALAGWSAALVAGVGCWVGAAALLSRLV